MLFEPTTLSATAKVIAETLEDQYSIDPVQVFEKAELDIDHMAIPGARYPSRKMQALWRAAVGTTGDNCFGLFAGRRIRPTGFHALGFSWIASQTLLGALRRLVRYHDILTTVPLHMNIVRVGNTYELTIEYPDPEHAPEIASIDAFVTAIVQMCRAATDSNFSPQSIAFKRSDRGSIGTYYDILGCPVTTGAEHITIRFDREALEKSLPGDNLALAKANDSVAEEYLEALDPRTVTSEVRELLIQHLPSGNSNQTRIAERMNRSLSTLQRQLHQEGANFQQIRDDTRRELAAEYIRAGKLSLSQIAYMLGFSDQSNFSRAFKRWTGVAPKDFE